MPAWLCIFRLHVWEILSKNAQQVFRCSAGIYYHLALTNLGLLSRVKGSALPPRVEALSLFRVVCVIVVVFGLVHACGKYFWIFGATSLFFYA